MISLHLWPYEGSYMTSWKRRKEHELDLQMGQQLSKYKMKTSGLCILADTFRGGEGKIFQWMEQQAVHSTWYGRSGLK